MTESSVESTLYDRLMAKLQAESVQIIDESHLHVGHAGAADGGKHFSVTVVAAVFENTRTLARHRLVYDAAGDLIPEKVHALSITALATSDI